MPGMGRAADYDRRFVPQLYDLDVRLTSRVVWGTSVAEQVRFAAAAIDAADGRPVLEVPVGTGLITARAVAAARTRPPIVAVDLSGAVLRRARGRLGARAACVLADVAHLPFRDGAFSVVHSGNGFHLFPDRPAAAAELARTLRPGGLAAITTWTDRGRWAARAFQRLLARLDAIDPPRTVDEHVRTFTGAGLVERSRALGGTLLRWTGTRR
jgi:ubiquinone/menaquinone biosynthesis C-methylase UbiE